MGLDPFKGVINRRLPQGGLEPDGHHVAGDTPYRTRAGHITGLDWDALRPSTSTEETA